MMLGDKIRQHHQGMSQSCEAKRINLNSLEAARADYLSCLGPTARGSAALDEARERMDLAVREGEGLLKMNEFLLTSLRRESGSGSTLGTLEDLASDTIASTEADIEALKAQIRSQRRRFLDAAPSVSPAVGGLYYTQTPDNQVLIAFMACFGAFLAFLSVLVLMNQMPGLEYLTMGERVKYVVVGWIAAAIVVYVGFYLFT
jgi:hypothetical protein